MRKVLLILLSLLMVLPLSVIPAGASTVGGSLETFEEQNVLTDLIGAQMGDKPFSLENYPYRSGCTAADMQVLTLFEYGWSSCAASDSRYDDYALFLYVYNPGDISVSKRNFRHGITLAFGDGAYEKYSLRLLSYAGNAAHEKLLLKFKVQISAEQLRTLCGDGAARTYRMSEFEVYAGGTNATANEGSTYTYTGTMTGYGAGDLHAEVTETETLTLSLDHCVWRTENSSKGKGYKTQLDSVYFSIPNEVLERYGNTIAAIKYHAYKYDSGYVAVFRDDENGMKAYDLFKPYEGITLTEPNRELPVLCDNRDVNLHAVFCYNNRKYLGVWFASNPTIEADTLSYVFQMPASTGTDSIIETALQERLIADWDAYNEGLVQSVFTGDKEDHAVTTEVWCDEPWTIDTKGNANLFQKLLFSGAYKSKPDDFEDIEPIRIVQASDFSNFVNTLRVDTYYYDDLKEAYNEAVQNDESLVLFHFDTSDYFAIEVESNSFFLEDGSDLYVYGEPGFVANETVYMDFDLIDLTFEKDGVYTVLPCVANPIHVIADLQTPSTGGLADDLPDWLKILLVVAAIIILLVLLPIVGPVLVPLLKGLVWLVLLPFKLLWWLLKALGRGIGALFRKKE